MAGGLIECRRLSTTSQSFQYLEEQSCREAFCSGNVLLYPGFSHFDGFGSVYDITVGLEHTSV